MCRIWLRSDGRVEKKGGTDRQTDKVTLQFYIVEDKKEKTARPENVDNENLMSRPQIGQRSKKKIDCTIIHDRVAIRVSTINGLESHQT